LPLDIVAADGDAYVVATRHESEAIRFHLPSSTKAWRDRRNVVFQFRVAGSSGAEARRRGIVGTALRIFLLKVAGKATEKFLAAAAGVWEERSWRSASCNRGWVKLDQTSLLGKTPLPQADMGLLEPPPKRNLLLLHGTFSSAEAAFRELASTARSDGQTFFSALSHDYEERLFAFNHFTWSQTPEENARDLLKSLPKGPWLFDVVTHSRGGLVLRCLADPHGALHGLADNFQLGRAALVAAPNEGTPLAAPRRMEALLTWLANLLEICPSNPFTTAMDLIVGGLSWLAQHASGIVPGITAMDPDGQLVAELQGPPPPPANAFSALVSNYDPDEKLLLRIADAGVELFFGSANDLVVPTEGGWRVENSIPGERIGCFGSGGNLAGTVTHTNFFSQPATVEFLIRALRGDEQKLTPIDPTKAIVVNLWRGGPHTAAIAETPVRPADDVSAAAAAEPDVSASVAAKTAPAPGPSAEILYLSFMPLSDGAKSLSLLASFRNAQVMAEVPTPNSPAWDNVWTVYKGIRNYLNGDPGVTALPHGDELLKLGSELFELLFPGDVRRLYDAARAAQGSRRLQVVFTSAVNEIAALPWEFVYDPSRRVYLAAEEVNFVRNVQTAIPADRIDPRPGPLRVLVVVAQPLNLARLSAEAETEAMLEGFRDLIDRRLAEVKVLLDATPEKLHRKLENAHRPFDVIHFIGHGEFDDKTDRGRLLFEGPQGGATPLDSDTLRQIVCRRGIRLVFLNACETGRGAAMDFTRGVAPDLVANGVPAVVANQFSVLDASATWFARHFYWSLAQGRALGDAAREARVAVNYSIPGENIDWAVPVLFARNPGDALIDPQPESPLSTATPVSTRQRRGSPRRAGRVALWDMHRSIPNLDAIAQQMTAAQERFGFESVPVSVPLGTWRRRQTNDGVYFDPKGVVEALHGKLHELGVDFLLCLTYLPLPNNFYVWKTGALCFVSTAAFRDVFDPPRTSLARLIVNATAFYLAGEGSHEGGPKTCINYFNDELDVVAAAGPLSICEACREKLPDKKLVEALDNLLSAFR
jgi:hypothetical protein